MQVILITGASDGIGAEMARLWAMQRKGDVALVLAARGIDKLEAVAQACRATGAKVLVQRCDVGVQSDCVALVDAAIRAFGHIDILVNNAGVSAHARFEEVTDLSWYETLMRINHWGSVWCTHAALPHLKASRGRIVAVASLAGLVGVPGRTAYSGSKFAMVGFFESLRTELFGTGVSVTIAYPGVVATKIRYRGFNAQGQPSGKSGLDETADPIHVTCRTEVGRALLQDFEDLRARRGFHWCAVSRKCRRHPLYSRRAEGRARHSTRTRVSSLPSAGPRGRRVRAMRGDASRFSA